MLQTPHNVVGCIQSFLEQAKLFEQREDHFIVHVDQTRDWPLGSLNRLGVTSFRLACFLFVTG